MPVLGIDFGTSCCVVTAARRGGVEVVVNDLSKRATPCVVSFGSVERFIGEQGANQLTFNSENSVPLIKRLIGLKYSQVKDELSNFTCKILQGENDTILCKVKYMDKEKLFTPVQILAMLFGRLKYLAEKDTNDYSPTSAVISVPGYFTEEQRRAVLQAGEIAGITVLRLLNEATGSAIVHGIYTEDLSENLHHVAFVDIGHSNTSVSIVKFEKEKISIVGSAYERNLGAGTFEDMLFDYFVPEIKKKYKLDVLTSAKATLRLKTACEKLKKVLGANSSGNLRVECLMEDTDISFTMERSQFEEMAKPYLEKLSHPVQSALETSGLTLNDISYVQLIGGGSYIPIVRSVVTKIFEPVKVGTTVNATESISRGCGLAAAMHSNKFSLAKRFEFTEGVVYPIDLGWKSDEVVTDAIDEEITKTTQVFKLNDVIPSAKLLKFQKNHDFNIFALYADNKHLQNGTNKKMAKISITGISKDKKIEEIRVKIGLNKNGLIYVESAQQVEEIEVEEIVKNDKDDKAAPEKKLVKKSVRTDLTVSVIAHQYSVKEMSHFKSEEQVLKDQDDLIFTTSEAKNSIESYIYDMQQKIGPGGELHDYISHKQRDHFNKVLSDKEEWLSCDGEKETKEVYKKVLDELRQLGNPILKRRDEDLKRPAAIKILKGMIDDFVTFASFVDDSNAHITHEEREVIKAKCNESDIWLNQMIHQQSKLHKNEEPHLTVEMIKDHTHALTNVCNPIKHKPKPKEEPKKEEIKVDEEKKEDKMDEEKK